MHFFLRWNVLLLFLCLTIIGCSKDEDATLPEPPTAEQYRRTVLVYAVAQNDLGYSGSRVSNFSADSLELLMGCQYLNDDEVLLLFVDDAHAPRIYKYAKETRRPEIVRQWKEDVCSSSPQVLRDVLQWTKQNFPATDYGLVMWSHADGWLPAVNKDYEEVSTRSFGIDVGSDGKMSSNLTADYKIGAQMDIHEMSDAIESSGVHLKYIFFDACLMQNIETCYDLRYATDYVVASPISIPANGANYTSQMRDGLFNDDVTRIADTYLFDVTDPLQVADYDDFGVVFSVVRTEYMDELAKVCAKLLPNSNLVNRTSLNMQDILKYHAYSSSYHYRPHQFDAQESMKKALSADAYEEFSKVLEKVVLKKVSTESFWVGPGFYTYQDVDLNNFSGIAMFIPQEVYTTNASKTRHGDLNEAFRHTAWYRDAGWSVTQW